MRTQPTLRIPLGILALLFALGLYALGVAWASQWIGQLPIWAQTIVYLVLGVVWLLPLRRFLIWMEAGSWRGAPRNGLDRSQEPAGKERGADA